LNAREMWALMESPKRMANATAAGKLGSYGKNEIFLSPGSREYEISNRVASWAYS